MSAASHVERDERTVSVENVSYRWAYFFLTYALLVDVALRSFVGRESSWDLMALIVAGGSLAAVYQAKHQILSRNWVKMSLVAALVAAVTAAILILAR